MDGAGSVCGWLPSLAKVAVCGHYTKFGGCFFAFQRGDSAFLLLLCRFLWKAEPIGYDKNRDKPLVLDAVPAGYDKNRNKPLEEDGGKALQSVFRLGLIRAGLLTPQAESCPRLLSEGSHPLQGDKPK